MKIRRSLLHDDVIVERYVGEGSGGPEHEPPVIVRVNVDAKRRLVRGSSGDETVAEITLLAHPDDADRFTVESRVGWRGRTSQVLDVKTHTVRGRATHVEVTCG